MRTIITIILTCLLACSLSACKSKRHFAVTADSKVTAEHLTTSSSEEAETITSGSTERTTKEVLADLAENLSAVITTERLDTSGRVVERTTAVINAERRQETKKKDVAEKRDTTTTERRAEEYHRDTTFTMADMSASVEEELERSPSFGNVLIFVALVAAAVYVFKRIFLC